MVIILNQQKCLRDTEKNTLRQTAMEFLNHFTKLVKMSSKAIFLRNATKYVVSPSFNR